jgi:hypothetical protein
MLINRSDKVISSNLDLHSVSMDKGGKVSPYYNNSGITKLRGNLGTVAEETVHLLYWSHLVYGETWKEGLSLWKGPGPL